MPRARARVIAAALAAVAGVAATCAMYAPGVMSSDSIYAYRQATTGIIEGWTKTPFVPYLWMGIVKIVPGPFGMLLFQNLVFWTGLALIALAVPARPIASAATVLAIGFFPSVFALLGTLWSDVLLAACLTLFAGLVLTGAARQSRWLLALSILPLWAGLACRVNALPAIVPLVAWLVAVWPRGGQATIGARRLAAISLALLVGLLAATRLFDRAVIDRGSGSSARALQFVFFHDLAGIAVHTGDLRLPPRVYASIPGMSLDVIRSAYDPADVNLLIYNPRWPSSAFLTADPAEFRTLVGMWAGAIAAHPGAYLRRRAEAVAASLQITSISYPFQTGIDTNDLGLAFPPRPAYTRWTEWLYRNQGVVFRGWVFAILAGVIVGVGVKRRRWSAVAVCASGLLYAAPIAVITTGSDFRYIWWLVVSALAGVPLLLRDRSA